MTLTKDSFNSDLKISFGTYFLSLGPIPPSHPMILLVLASSHFTVDSSRLGTSSSTKKFFLAPAVVSATRFFAQANRRENFAHTHQRGFYQQLACGLKSSGLRQFPLSSLVRLLFCEKEFELVAKCPRLSKPPSTHTNQALGEVRPVPPT